MLLCLVYMSFQRHELHHDRHISYLSKEQLLFLRNGNQAFAIGVRNETKNAFALQALSTYYNCQIKYLQLKKGKNNFHFKYTRVQITLRDHLRIKLKTKKQSDKMKVY